VRVGHAHNTLAQNNAKRIIFMRVGHAGGILAQKSCKNFTHYTSIIFACNFHKGYFISKPKAAPFLTIHIKIFSMCLIIQESICPLVVWWSESPTVIQQTRVQSPTENLKNKTFSG